jgi:hypothetical protein
MPYYLITIPLMDTRGIMILTVQVPVFNTKDLAGYLPTLIRIRFELPLSHGHADILEVELRVSTFLLYFHYFFNEHEQSIDVVRKIITSS